MSSLKPLADRVLVKPDEAEQKTASGLYIASNAQEKPQRGTIVAVGAGKVNDKGERIPMDVKVGDVVIYGKFGGNEVKVDGEKYLLMRADDIYAVVGDGRGTERALQSDVTALGAHGDGNGIGQSVDALGKLSAGIGVERNVLCHGR